MAKGGEFERSICKTLSLWLSHGKRDDYLWRSSQSGGRATVRHRKKLRTAGHAGDIAPTCNRGRRLTRHVTLELKTGYESCSLYNLLDHKGVNNGLMMQGFIDQAKAAKKVCGTKYWAIIQRRKGRDIMILSTQEFFHSLDCMEYEAALFHTEHQGIISVMRLSTFLKHADPTLLRRRKR